MQALLILLICLVTLAILAGRYGVDSRDGLDQSPPDRARSRGRRQRAVLADLGLRTSAERSRLPWTYLLRELLEQSRARSAVYNVITNQVPVTTEVDTP